ncbi:MAG TPA: ABC transporter permease [Candidatus Sulfopaludibacter sp.]|nr:ABC transporter permease [Candidatus Sulfopaludibacter sp.]
MHKILTIAKRDYVATVRTKAFLFGLVVAPMLFGGGSVALSFFKSKPDLRDKRIAILDHTGLVAPALVSAATEKNQRDLYDKVTHQQIAPRYVFEVVPPDDDSNATLLILSDRVRRKELAAFLEIGKLALRPVEPVQDPVPGLETKTDPDTRVAYYTNAGGLDEMRNWLGGPINDGVRLTRLSQLGIDIAGNKGLLASVPVEGMSLLERDLKTGAVQAARKRSELEGFFVPFAVAMILTMIVMIGSAPMLQNVTQDKSQRIVETLLGSASPLELMAGKVMGSVGVSVTSSLLYVVAGVLVVNALGIAGLLPLTLIPWFYAYLLADVVMLCAFAAALGACCSTPQDAQNLAIVLLMPCMIPMFTLVTVLRQPNGVMSTVMSLIPPFTPILMLLRQASNTGVPVWQPWVGLVGVLIFASATVWAASRIFRVAILMHGKPPQLAQLLRWAWKG